MKTQTVPGESYLPKSVKTSAQDTECSKFVTIFFLSKESTHLEARYILDKVIQTCRKFKLRD